MSYIKRTVSTHSRPKAAVKMHFFLLFVILFQHTAARRRLDIRWNGRAYDAGFNTQPPEGGC